MSSEASQNTTGTIIRGADGSLYFIRDEVLQACKVTEPEMAQFINELVEEHSGDVSGFALSSGLVQNSLVMSGPFNAARSPLGQVASTVMCPGSMSLKNQFAVLPAMNFR